MGLDGEANQVSASRTIGDDDVGFTLLELRSTGTEASETGYREIQSR